MGNNSSAEPEVRQEPLAATVCYDDAGTSSSQSLDGAETSSSGTPDGAETSSSQRPDRAETSSSQRPGGADGCPLPQTTVVDGPVQIQTQVNKLEVTLSLLQGGEIEGFTIFQIESNRVVEVRRAMEVLRTHGNLIFSSFLRDIGSRTPRAHAGCYDFEEIFQLILNEGYTIQKVNLSSQHACSISGKSMNILQTALLAWMQYYQLSSVPTPSLITMLVLMVSLPLVSMFLVPILSEKESAKRFVHSLINRFLPNQVGEWYEYFQLKRPCLTFCNESYGHPCTFKDCRVICCFVGTALRVPGNPHVEYFTGYNMFDVGAKLYCLRNVNLLLEIKRDEQDDEAEAFVVYVTSKWAKNGDEFYQSVFRVIDNRRISNLIAVLNWLGDNNCQGVCKEWKENTMHAFTFEELIGKILDEKHYYQPWMIHYNNGITVHVE